MVALPRHRVPVFRSEESIFGALGMPQEARLSWQARGGCGGPKLVGLGERFSGSQGRRWDHWLRRYLAACGSGMRVAPVDFLYWLFRHPELPASQRAEVAHMLAIELIQQEQEIRRDQLEQFFRWNRASRRRLRRGGFSPRDRVVVNPLVIRLCWQEPSGEQGVQTMQEVQWLFFPAESRLVALRPRPGVLELLAPLSGSGSQGIPLGQWLEQLAPEQAARVVRLLPELFRLGLVAAVE